MRFMSPILPGLLLLSVGQASAQAPSKAFDALLAPHFAADRPGASVCVMKDGKVIYAKGFGLASRELKVPNRPGLAYRIASVTKQFTAAAVLALVEDGKVGLDAPIGTYLKELPEAWRAVTVRQLLNHTGGIPNYTEELSYRARMREDLPGLKLLQAHVWTKPLDFAPGSQWHYSNSGYYLLGLLIEQVSGTPYGSFLEARFFTPLGLTRTTYGTETAFVPGLATGYGEGGQPASYLSLNQAFAAGALVSTAEDLARWTHALHGGKVVNAESLRLMTRPTRTSDGKEHPYGFGLGFRTLAGHRLIGHNGGINGFSSTVEADPEGHTVAVLLFNEEQPEVGAEYLSRRLLALAAGVPVLDPKPVVLPASKLARLAGTYQHAEGYRRTLALTPTGLTSQVGGGRPYRLTPLSEDTFRMDGQDIHLRFKLKGDDVVGLHRVGLGEPEGSLAPKIPDVVRKAIKVSPAAMDAVAGTYELAPGMEIKVWRDGERLLAQLTGQSPDELLAESESRFFIQAEDTQFEFPRDAEGRCPELQLNAGGRRMTGKRVK